MPKAITIHTATTTFAHLKITTEADARRHQQTQIAARIKAGAEEVEIREEADPRVARVDFGRWLIDCACGSGVAVHPDWAAAYCFGCGAIWTAVTFPADRAAVEAALVVRPQRHRFFFPESETVAMLHEENRAHGLPVDPPKTPHTADGGLDVAVGGRRNGQGD